MAIILEIFCFEDAHRVKSPRFESWCCSLAAALPKEMLTYFVKSKTVTMKLCGSGWSAELDVTEWVKANQQQTVSVSMVMMNFTE